MSRLGDCLTAGPSIESARRGIRLRSQMARSEQDTSPPRLVALPPSGVVGTHTDRRAWIPDSPRLSIQADISPARRKRGERSSGGSRIHSGSRHYHKDGNCTDGTGRRWISKGLRFQSRHAWRRGVLIIVATPYHGPGATAASLRSICNSAPCKGPIRDDLIAAEGRTKTTGHPRELAGRGWWRQLRPRNRLSSGEFLE